MSEAIVPFRWDIGRREQLGRLVDIPPPPLDPLIRDELRACCARILALAGDSRLVFVGRSPETIFDYLSGLLRETSWKDRLALLQVSIYWNRPGKLLASEPNAVMAFSGYLRRLGLDPRAIRSSERPICFVDVVSTGATFGNLTEFVRLWAREIGVDWHDVQRRLRFVGITPRSGRGPKTQRWNKSQRWVAKVPDAVIRNVSAGWGFWSFLAAREEKATDSHGSWRWNDPAAEQPARAAERLAGLALAVMAYDWGLEAEERTHMARLLAAERAMAEPWMRKLVLELKARSRGRRILRRGRAGGDPLFRLR